jgi:hypothetical protein
MIPRQVPSNGGWHHTTTEPDHDGARRASNQPSTLTRHHHQQMQELLVVVQTICLGHRQVCGLPRPSRGAVTLPWNGPEKA